MIEPLNPKSDDFQQSNTKNLSFQVVLAVKPMSVEQSQQIAWKDLDQAPVSFSNGMPVTLVELCLGEVPWTPQLALHLDKIQISST